MRLFALVDKFLVVHIAAKFQQESLIKTKLNFD
jgi:hypothetical protein